jgi:hypothetical protein
LAFLFHRRRPASTAWARRTPYATESVALSAAAMRQPYRISARPLG